MLTAMLAALQAAAVAQECRTFAQIYGNGRNLCERIFDGAFRYVGRDDPQFNLSYTMWFFDAENPNDAVTSRRIEAELHDANYSNTDQCHLQYYHKTKPGPEPDSFTECHPWKSRSCCHEETVESAAKLRDAYGPEWRWDRCGSLSSECERFFVQEACFYECDPNAGLFRKYPPGTFDDKNPTHNLWQMHNMPINGDYCDSWYTACRNEKFCAEDDGNFFSCAAYFPERTPSRSSNRILIVVLTILAVLLAISVSLLVYKECKGKAFRPLIDKPGYEMESALPESNVGPNYT